MRPLPHQLERTAEHGVLVGERDVGFERALERALGVGRERLFVSVAE